jgi:pyridoxal biosynthesis lyase PdxS
MRTFFSKAAGFGFAAVCAAAGCASTPLPADQMASAQASIRAAGEVGAHDVPQAALHLQLAKEQVEHAKQLIKQDDNERARYVLARAESDAELALAEARDRAESDQADQALREAQSLEQRAGKP